MKLVLGIIILLLSGHTIAQITVTEAASPVASSEVPVYDSTTNFLKEGIAAYKGQQWYLKGKPPSRRKEEVYNLVRDYQNPFRGKAVRYEEVAEKYFQVTDVLDHPAATKSPQLQNVKFVQLKEKESSKIYYYEYNPAYEVSFPFIVVGYYEKLKQTMAGKRIVTNARFAKSQLNATDVITGKKLLPVEPGEVWTILDVTIDKRQYELAARVQNSRSEQALIDLQALETRTIGFTREEAIRYQEEFGAVLWKMILQNKLSIGMAPQVCELSWGIPKKKGPGNYSGKPTIEWVYDDNRLHFRDDKLYAIQ